MGHAAHGPEAHHVGVELLQVTLKEAVIVSFDPQTGGYRLAGKVVIAPIPPQLTVNARLMAVRHSGMPKVRG
jgi:hypothetical protein